MKKLIIIALLLPIILGSCEGWSLDPNFNTGTNTPVKKPTYTPTSEESNTANNTVDSATIKRLSSHFRIEKDEFKGIKWYYHKTSPKYVNTNSIYCYFSHDDADDNNLRLVISYYADDWLFIKSFQFLIDGKPYEFEPDKIKSDNADGYVWEWCDQRVYGHIDDIVNALTRAKSAKVKMSGTNYYKIRTITPKQIAVIKETVEYYQAMGGKLLTSKLAL